VLTLVGSQLPGHDASSPASPGAAGSAVSASSTAHAASEPRVAWNLAQLLLQTVREHIDGAPLDAQAEAKARGSDWR
jgi:hypothetical protein